MRPTDSIADMLTRIRNASCAEQRFVDIPRSNIKLNIVKILKEQGFIESFLEREDDKQGSIRVFLKYGKARKPILNGLQRESSPGGRHYVSRKHIPRVLGGMGISIVSTSQGIITGDDAKKRKLGGELICNVW